MSSRLVALSAALFSLLGLGAVAAFVSSYGAITGYATVEPSISFEIMESYSDVVYNETEGSRYVLWDPHQGETKWVEIKVVNRADTCLRLVLNVTSSNPGITTSIWGFNRSQELSNPVIASPGNTYFYIRHYIRPDADPASYTFFVDLLPA
ncbi:MAG: hypothetical protein QXU82_02780 [Candidatus Aenigmatarchaeota archaeon]